MRCSLTLRFPARAMCDATLAAALLVASSSALAAGSSHYAQTNLVTDDQTILTGLGFDPATTVDASLINPWGMSYGPTSPFWISNQGSNTSTLYNGAGSKIPLTVSIPSAASGPAGPTGQVFNGTTSFGLPSGGPGLFLFANLDGTISGWNPAQGTSAVVVADHPAVYTGIAMGNTGGNDYLYVANGLSGKIDVFDSGFALTTLSGGFVDPGPNPDGLVPFNVRNLGGHLFVTYAIPGPDADEASLGQGFVSEFDLDGNFVRRFATGGNLLSPWGLEIAPTGFGAFGGALLVGNFSEDEGLINAFRLSDGTYLGSLEDLDGNDLEIPYLWSLLVGNGGAGGDPAKLYFTAGIGDEEHGLFGSLNTVPEPAQWGMLLTGFGVMGAALRRNRRQRSFAVSC